MPKLTVYEGFSRLSYSFNDDKNPIVYDSFPYSFSRSLSTSYSKEEYLDEVIAKILSPYKLSKQDVEVENFGGLDYILKQMEKAPTDYFPILADHWFISSKTLFSYSVPNAAMEDLYLRNYNYYPQIKPITQSDLIKVDDYYVTTSKNFNLDKVTKVLLTGDRFLNIFDEGNSLPYIMYFVSNLIHQPGLYEIYIDDKNLFLIDENFSLGSATKFCILFIQNTDLECLLTTSMNTKQLIDIAKESLFVLPSQEDIDISLLVKARLGNTELKMGGVKQGVIFDTRDKSNTDYKNIQYIESSMQVFEEPTTFQ